MNRLADELSDTVQGQLKVGCLTSFTQLLVPSLRREFEAMYPLARVSQFELDQLAIFDQLRDAEIDVALTYDLDIPSDIDFLPLKELPPYAVFCESHPLANLVEVSPATLQQYNMVLLDLPRSAEYFLSLFDELGARPRIIERTRDMAVMRSLVANGFGYSIVNIRPLNDMAPDGRPLRFLPLKGPVRPMNLGIALISDAAKASTVQTFVEHCQSFVASSDVLNRTL